MPSFYEFFAGGGMARAGLGEEWERLFANDNDAKKAASYTANWGAGHLRIADVGALTAAEIPGRADLAGSCGYRRAPLGGIQYRLENMLRQMAHDGNHDAIAGEMVRLVVILRELVLVRQAHESRRFPA